MTVGIGSTVYLFDSNRRVYRTDSNGHGVGGPIFREHFRPHVITQETPRSWVLDSGAKVPKVGGDVRKCAGERCGKSQVFMSLQVVDDAVWIHDHRHRLSEALDRCKDVETLRKVAALVGYDAEQPKPEGSR